MAGMVTAWGVGLSELGGGAAVWNMSRALYCSCLMMSAVDRMGPEGTRACAITATTSARLCLAQYASISPMISSTRLQRSALVAYAGLSAPMSGRPIAAISRVYTLSPLPPMTTYLPSLVLNVPLGTTSEMVEPEGGLSYPACATSATQLSSMLNTLSLMDASTTCPSPAPAPPAARCLCSSAMTVPNAACSPASVSPRLMLGRAGGLSG
mmetsp:Transcript_2378/g.5987  ORF Transcript_2378/g.5987 Transcript_2378/m.5987 type:complete len:210 (-) Transcript_2378:651-1280(-)